MSERLQKRVNDALITTGAEVLSKNSGLTAESIREIAKGGRIPRRRNAYLLALACGADRQEALAIGYECSPQRAKGKAS